MQIRINGDVRSVRDGCTLSELLTQLELNPRFLAVERNRQLVPRGAHASCVLNADDELEIVTLVGGG